MNRLKGMNGANCQLAKINRRRLMNCYISERRGRKKKKKMIAFSSQEGAAWLITIKAVGKE